MGSVLITLAEIERARRKQKREKKFKEEEKEFMRGLRASFPLAFVPDKENMREALLQLGLSSEEVEGLLEGGKR